MQRNPMITRLLTTASVITVLLSFDVSAAPNDITRANVSSAEAQANGITGTPALSRNGNLVAFASAASNLEAFDSNGRIDVFVRNRATGTTTLKSESLSGSIGNGNSISPALAGSGGYVGFLSDATNLIVGDTNNIAADGNFDVFVKNLSSGAIERVSVATTGVEANGTSTEVSISDDGRYVVFTSAAKNLVVGDSNNSRDIFLRDTLNDTTVRVSQTQSAIEANGDSFAPVISGDGAYIAFVSNATNLIPADTNAAADIFRYNVATQAIERISVDSLGLELDGPSLSPSISGNGNLVAFVSAENDIDTGDTNGTSDVFVRNVSGGSNSRVSESEDGTQANGASLSPAISWDGTKVAFVSDATNLISFDSNNTAKDGKFDLFVKTIGTGDVTRENETLSGGQVTGNASGNVIDEDGSVVAFLFDGSSLVSFDSNGLIDLFVTDTACTTDSDSDGTANCTDTCPFDAAKIVAGTCGCGVSDTDTDADGTADCNDLCGSDASKINPGACGCGVTDGDANGNGVADCSDPTANTVPRTATVNGGKGVLKVSVTEEFSRVTYQFVLVKDGRNVKSITTTKRAAKFSNLRKGTYRIKYRITVGGVNSKFSRNSAAVRVR